MLDQRTSLPRCKSAPAAADLPVVLGKVASFLEMFPGLPAPSLTVDSDSFHVQFSFLPSDVLFPSVARVARALGTEPLLKQMSDGHWHFTARGHRQGLDVTVFASVSLATDEVRVDEAVA
ncbi:hypothetical protein SMD11_5606 [Streptomyces albireticuli]|uniref:Uncharacterized protein n=1 Tax=Streptomyces albireticuli TaxID=1940 RepID=A0A1Z2LA57_9ACTN|nr:hypothetical protein [Streptomyces albireticuli]ARZ71185.1 hypothetical protein SMD11_5606 [Streptomyces albireticuli]